MVGWRRALAALAVILILLTTAGAIQASAGELGPVLGHATLVDCEEEPTDAPRPAWAGELTDRTPTGHTRYDVQVPSEDGRRVAARVYLPTAFERPHPTILILSPYWSAYGVYFKEAEDAGVRPASCWAQYFLDHGYAVVLGDMTGTHNSDGCFDYGGPDDRADGAALVRWITDQGFSDGNVGMYGVSHVGFSQYITAVTGVDGLEAILPVAPITNWYSYLYDGGVHYETNMATPPAYEYAVAAPPPTNLGPGWPDRVRQTACNTPQPTVDQMRPERGMDAYYKARDLTRRAGNVSAAVFHVQGTQDENVQTNHFTQMWQALEAENVERKALLGPWRHHEPDLHWWNLTALRWFEHHLKGIDTGMMDEPRVTLIDRSGTERHAERFPPASATTLVLEAGDSGPLNRGRLLQDAPEGTATYVDNPGLRRQAMRSAAPHRVLYTSPPLDEPLRLTGSPMAEVTASIDRTDVHLVAYVYEVGRDGEADYVTRGYLDARFRNGVEADPQPVPPGEPITYEIHMDARERVLDEGHRVELLIASSDHCPWLFTVTGLDPKNCEWSGIVPNDQVAQVTIHEGGDTRLQLPTTPRGAS